ncbi:hypothetical protein JVT61DRAFT_15074 [Boletus reticuloceps]|uniref:Uncharacterized protein n=1 Tax=Boletus reticuloceps TaxID=495285 RepID=A0A8I2YV62_9AGAM|nr:hypothetical protein JVT61DRAFT_15074 [Boletus reticuloceps]
MAHIRPRCKSAWTTCRVDGAVGAIEVEAGPRLVTHTKTQVEHTENSVGDGRATIAIMGRPCQSTRTVSPITTTFSPTSTNFPGEMLTMIITFAWMVVVPLVITLMIVLVSRLGWEVFGEFVHVFRFRSRRATCQVWSFIAQPSVYRIEHDVDLQSAWADPPSGMLHFPLLPTHVHGSCTRLPPLDFPTRQLATTTAGAGAPTDATAPPP